MYVLFSDPHCHNWSAFSKALPGGVNSRLQIILDELIRAAEAAKSRGDCMVCGGDLFHVRGSIAPSVLNPVLDTFHKIVKEMEVEVFVIPGNHDLESRDATALTNGAQALSTVGVTMINELTKVYTPDGDTLIMVPWFDSLDQLKTQLESNADKNADLIIHAPVDGVIPGLPDHGLTPEYLANLGFKRVFAGHYHNHVDFGNGVYSIGATTHQTWGDVGSRAGFLEIDDPKLGEQVHYEASHAPEFITLEPETPEGDIPLLVDGNYVRVHMEAEKDSQIKEMQEFLVEQGALGVVVHAVKKNASVSRSGATTKSGASLEDALGEFIKAKKHPREKELTGLCASILSEVA